MIEVVLPLIVITAVIFILGMTTLIALYIWSKYSLEYKASKINESEDLLYRTKDGDYYDHKYKKRDWIQINRNRLIYTRDKAFLRPEKRTVIHLSSIKRTAVYFFMIFVQTDNGNVYRIPTGFENQDEIYSALKHYKPTPLRSTR